MPRLSVGCYYYCPLGVIKFVSWVSKLLVHLAYQTQHIAVTICHLCVCVYVTTTL